MTQLTNAGSLAGRKKVLANINDTNDIRLCILWEETVFCRFRDIRIRIDGSTRAFRRSFFPNGWLSGQWPRRKALEILSWQKQPIHTVVE